MDGFYLLQSAAKWTYNNDDDDDDDDDDNNNNNNNNVHLSCAHMIHINLKIISCVHVEHSPTKTPHTKHHTDIFINGHWIVSLHVAGQFA